MKIHVNSKNLSCAAEQYLGVSHILLAVYLGKLQAKIVTKQCDLNFEWLNKSSEASVREIFQQNNLEYDQAILLESRDINTLLFNEIHNAIIKYKNIHNVACSLGVCKQSLNLYLGRLNMQGFTDQLDMSFAGLRKCKKRTALKILGDKYYTHIAVEAVDISKIAFNKIHYAIRRAKDSYKAAISLGIHHRRLHIYIARLKDLFATDEIEISFAGLKKCNDQEKLDRVFGDNYYTCIPVKELCLSNIAFAKIHQAILKSDNLHQAAAKYLGVNGYALIIYLRRLKDSIRSNKIYKN